MIQSKIIISRASAVIACAKKYKIELDGIVVAELGNGKTVEITVNEGSHTLSFIAFGKCEKTITVNVDENTEPIFINARLVGSNSKIELQTNNNQSVVSNTMTNMTSSANNKNTLPTGAIIAIVVVILITMFSIIAILSSPSTTNTSIDAISQQEDLTPDEKAEQLIQIATKEFDEGDYIEAVNICNKIIAEYPETETSKNMLNYLNEQYGQFNNISASRLMSEYTENIVNADEEYTGEILVVDGVVSSIDKTNNGNNLCVLLKSNTYFASVQLNFDTDQADAVSKLSTGSKIKAIGKCTGKSGKHFIILDGNNVMIEDCYIIK